LTIDDNIDITMLVKEYCKKEKIDCKEINDGQKGLFEIQKRHYDLILLDIAMPFYTGFDILRQLKKQGVRDQCIVILTGTNLKIEDIADCMDVGVREILKKPIGLDLLDKVVKRYLTNERWPVHQ
ncbi:MAG TPA: response regulator, partial [Candidatus Nitrosocosmicus sp.]|nr:response regulator [Candidatus Nitrosocosmicus sp.]